MSIFFEILNISVVSVVSDETIFNVVWKIRVISVVRDETVFHLVLENSAISVLFFICFILIYSIADVKFTSLIHAKYS